MPVPEDSRRFPLVESKAPGTLLAEGGGEEGQAFPEVGGQGPGRIDDEHSAALHAKPVAAWRRDVQTDIQPGIDRQAAQAARQAARFAACEKGIPDGVDAGGETLESLAEGPDHLSVVFPRLVGRVDEHQTPPRGGRQQGLDSRQTVRTRDADLATRVGESAGQNFGLVAMQFEKPQTVLRPQHGPG